jgi:hypothetical protein
MNIRKHPRISSLVKFAPPTRRKGSGVSRYPFRRNSAYIFFGEIPNMPGHCVVGDPKTGRLFAGYHIENFVELSESET